LNIKVEKIKYYLKNIT